MQPPAMAWPFTATMSGFGSANSSSSMRESAGTKFSGTSYATGESRSEGDSVDVEYDEKDPQRSRIAGMRRAQFGPFVSFVAIFALIGFGIVYFATRSGFRRNHVLSHGMLTTGKLVAKERTNMTVNKRPVWKLTFEFTGRDGRVHEAAAHSTDTARLEDESQEALLYDPDDPSRAYVLDEAPARPEFDYTGELKPKPAKAVFALILPTLVIGGNLFALSLKMGWLRL